MFCPSCNAPNREDAKFCKSCGQSLHTVQAGAPVAAEVPAEVASLPAAPQVPEAVAGGSQSEEQEDVSQAPTLILSPEKVIAYRSRFWRQDEEIAQQSGQASEPYPSAHPSDLPTMLLSPAAEQAGSISPLADQPSLLPPDQSATPGPAPVPPLPQEAAGEREVTFDTEAGFALEESAEQREASVAMNSQPLSNEGAAREEQPAEMPAGDFTPRTVGETLAGRYEVTQIISESSHECAYQVIDHEGYQHCWNCDSEQNAEGDEFCIDCGASMLNVPYILHEYAASGSAASDVDVLQGAIVNTFVDRGRTYAVEQTSLNQSAFPAGVQLLAATSSDAGNIRRSDPNEDSTLVLHLQRVHESFCTPTGIFIVADGLGGHDSGQVASRIAVSIIAERMVRELLAGPLQAEKESGNPGPLGEDDLVGLLRNTVEEANLALCQRNQQDKTDMGSTLTGYMIVGEHAYIVNVGDSRTYMLRGGQIYQLTTDHSLVGQLVAGGLIEPDDVYTHPNRSQIFRSLGDKPNVQIDVFKQQLLPGDILLGCSDGLWEMVRNPQIESILNSAPDPQTACTQLIDAANTNGGEDNISAVIVFVR
jgi:serine/threonine protein phosphatase PrpC